MVTLDSRLDIIQTDLDSIATNLALDLDGILELVQNLYPGFNGNKWDAQYILYGSSSTILMRYLTIVECYLRTLDPLVLDTVIKDVIKLHENNNWLQKFYRGLVDLAVKQVKIPGSGKEKGVKKKKKDDDSETADEKK